MGQTYQSTVINAPAEKVWNAIRNLQDLSWAPNVITIGLSILISLTLGACAGERDALRAGDPIEVAADHYRMVRQSGHVRLVHASWRPGERDNLHGHPELIWYALTPFRLLLETPAGEAREIEGIEGGTGISAPVNAHVAHNLGDTPVELLLFELTSTPTGAAMEGDVPDAVTSSPDNYQVLRETNTARLVLAHWAPGQADNLHNHPEMIVYALTDVTLQLTTRDGATREVVLRAGESLVSKSDGGHTAKNVGKEEARLLLLEPR